MHKRKAGFAQKTSQLVKEFNQCNFTWAGILFYTYLAVSGYLFFEELFIFTKPSIYSSLPFLEKIGVLFFASSLFTLAALVVILAIMLISRLPLIRRHQRPVQLIALFLPAAICAALFLIQIDNITYTALGIGIATTHGFRFLYILFFGFMLAYFYLNFAPKVIGFYELIGYRISHRLLMPALLAINVILLLTTYASNPAISLAQGMQNVIEKKDLPNIVFITADGLNATHMSAYGYKRNTTPGIQGLMKSSLVAENAFTNSGKTEGSLISIYTGRDPASTRVLFPPDILKGSDSYLHLPGILQSLGYYTAQYTFAYYADAYAENLLNGFDYANGRSYTKSSLFYLLNSQVETDRAHLIYELAQRILDRFGHIFNIKNMANLQGLVEGSAQSYDDQVKIKNTLDLLKHSNQPVFIHIHYFGTHGPTFLTTSREFSAGKDIDQQKEWDGDFYDDAVVDLDTTISGFINELDRNGLFENTVLLISSDHGAGWDFSQRIPLIIHFPDSKYSGRIQENVQLIDIAPTILDYLDYDIPEWMEGNSLLQPLPEKPIFTYNILRENTAGEYSTTYDMEPPFYQFGLIGLVYCDRLFQFDLKNLQLDTEAIQGHTSPCQDNSIPSNETVIQWMTDHLQDKGFDVEDLAGVTIDSVEGTF